MVQYVKRYKMPFKCCICLMSPSREKGHLTFMWIWLEGRKIKPDYQYVPVKESRTKRSCSLVKRSTFIVNYFHNVPNTVFAPLISLHITPTTWRMRALEAGHMCSSEQLKLHINTSTGISVFFFLCFTATPLSPSLHSHASHVVGLRAFFRKARIQMA